MNGSKNSALLALLMLIFAGVVNAQDLQTTIAKYTSENGKGYLQPLADAFGANLNSGLYHQARIKKSGLQLHFALVTMTAPIAEDQKTFTATTEDLFYPKTTVEAPTVFGRSENIAVEGVGGTAYIFPAGFDIKSVPVAVPQLSIGSLFGTQATLRYIEIDLGENWGPLNLYGWGIRHSINPYLPSLPVDLAIGYYRQTFKIGDIIDARTSLLTAQTSLTRGVLTFYGGIGYESSDLDILYQYETTDEAREISFDLQGQNSARLTFGVGLRFGPLQINSDYNLASQNVLVIGVGAEF
ncbi:hypothetical protein JW992_07760 [candidate division KSB1 bacterium]|nr:hypothetical protein [candidate division KSB1 bacterium]